MTDKTAALAKLREPFAPNQINTLPKPYSKDAPKSWCEMCNGKHGMPAAHLDYVGHAALTDRLLDADPDWTWEPVAMGADGLPMFDRNGGLWMRLTVAGVTRLGYGDAQGKTGPNAVKETIGDGLRNAGMRFGIALDLWHKGDLHDASVEQGSDQPAPAPKVIPEWVARIAAAADISDLSEIHADAAANGWATPELMQALTARKGTL